MTLGNTGSSGVLEQGLESKLDLSSRDVMRMDTILRAQYQPKHGGGKVPRVFSVVGRPRALRVGMGLRRKGEGLS